MSLFDRLVAQALKSQSELASLQAVVEKELLHHDVLREMSAAGLLSGLTFIGGTCLRVCYGASRLSEDLDFTGGQNFSREMLGDLAGVLVDRLQAKYGLTVGVSAPMRETGNVDTWKLKVDTRPEQKDSPAQRINIDIRAIPSYDRRPMMLRNHYGVEMGTSGLIIQAQSREEILADKLVALALRSNRIKNRDLWDIAWLKQQGIEPPLALIPKKIADHRRGPAEFAALLRARKTQLQTEPEVRDAFAREMRRFLPSKMVTETVDNEGFWAYLSGLAGSECDRVLASLRANVE